MRFLQVGHVPGSIWQVMEQFNQSNLMVRLRVGGLDNNILISGQGRLGLEVGVRGSVQSMIV